MIINKQLEEKKLTISLVGRLDVNTAPDLEKELNGLDELDCLIFDLKDLEYLSSTGLRIILSCQKKMNENGKMIVRNANEDIKDIFDITGFTDILTIE